ncbi:hypothetical protein B0H19DRAFT_1270790 [Mycena capillaripes]|nr:hypothetical protein B0H19DRAFT_1270790 [Mycena capillaripes]
MFLDKSDSQVTEHAQDFHARVYSVKIEYQKAASGERKYQDSKFGPSPNLSLRPESGEGRQGLLLARSLNTPTHSKQEQSRTPIPQFASNSQLHRAALPGRVTLFFSKSRIVPSANETTTCRPEFPTRRASPSDDSSEFEGAGSVPSRRGAHPKEANPRHSPLIVVIPIPWRLTFDLPDAFAYASDGSHSRRPASGSVSFSFSNWLALGRLKLQSIRNFTGQLSQVCASSRIPSTICCLPGRGRVTLFFSKSRIVPSANEATTSRPEFPTRRASPSDDSSEFECAWSVPSRRGAHPKEANPRQSPLIVVIPIPWWLTMDHTPDVVSLAQSRLRSRGGSPSPSESEDRMDHTPNVMSLARSPSNSQTGLRSADVWLSDMVIDSPPAAPVSSLLKRCHSPSVTPSNSKRFKREAAPSFIHRLFSNTQALLTSPFRSQSRVHHHTPPSPCPEQVGRSSSRADGWRDSFNSQFLSPELVSTIPGSARASSEDSLGDSPSAVTGNLTKQELIAILQDHEKKFGLKLDAAVSKLDAAVSKLDAAVSKLEAGAFRELHFLRNSRESESGAKTTRVTPSASAQSANSRTLVPSDPAHVALWSPAHTAAPPADELHTGSDRFVDSHSRRSLSRVATPDGQSQPATASNDSLFIPKIMHAVGILSNALEKCCAVCWTLTGQQYESDHEPFSSSHCGAGVSTGAVANEEFQNLQPSFPPSAGCSICWIPYVKVHRNFQSTNHSITGDTCIHPHAFKQIAWTVYQTHNLWEAFSIELRKIQADQPIEGWFSECADGLTNIGNTSSTMSVE